MNTDSQKNKRREILEVKPFPLITGITSQRYLIDTSDGLFLAEYRPGPDWGLWYLSMESKTGSPHGSVDLEHRSCGAFYVGGFNSLMEAIAGAAKAKTDPEWYSGLYRF